MKEKITTITREYDVQGKIIKEITTITEKFDDITEKFIPIPVDKNIKPNWNMITTMYGCQSNMTYDSGKQTKVYYQCPYGD